jgi:molybdopterin-guanine dinucleotide biosynthesis protein A
VTTDAPPTPGVLLAGGLARRMGGGDKPMRRIGGRTILERVIARLKPQCDGLILNANGDPARFATRRRRYRSEFSRTACGHFGGARLGRGE